MRSHQQTAVKDYYFDHIAHIEIIPKKRSSFMLDYNDSVDRLFKVFKTNLISFQTLPPSSLMESMQSMASKWSIPGSNPTS